MYDDLFADGIDGIHGLCRRERTRLWYRAMPQTEIIPDHLRVAIEHSPHLTVTAPDLVEAVRIHAVYSGLDAFTDLLVGEGPTMNLTDALIDIEPALTVEERQSRMLRRLGTHLDIEPIDGADAPTSSVEPLTDWRSVPHNAPTLLLSETALFDGRRPGPILAPGCQYRMLSAVEGVVRLEVMQADGAVASGYCNSVDLACIEPMLVHLAGGGGCKVTTRPRFKQSISQVTGTFSGLMS